jgi:hypothetical protein
MKSPVSATSSRTSTDAATHVSPSYLLIHAQLTYGFLRIMLAQRLAELASANAEGLLEYVALANIINKSFN